MKKEALYKKQKTNKEDKEMEQKLGQKLAGLMKDASLMPTEIKKKDFIKIYRNFRKQGRSASQAYRDTSIKINDDFAKSGKPYF